MRLYKGTAEVARRYRKDECNYFYVIRIHRGKERYLKVGITSQSPKKRFSGYRQSGYTIDEVYFICECQNNNEKIIEAYCQARWGQLPGLTFHEKDRFTYFSIPENLEQIVKEAISFSGQIFVEV